MASVSAPSTPATRQRRLQLTQRDHALLTFIAQHRLILPDHARVFLGLSLARTNDRLRGLARADLLTREAPRFHGRPGCYQISSAGLKTIGSPLTKPRFDLGSHEHDVGLVWLHLAALAGRFGPVRQVISEREMRSRDGRPDRDGLPLGVRLGGSGPGGRERLHYPDLLLRTDSGHTVAIELELTGKGRSRREQILGGYAAEPRVDAVVYLADRPSVQRGIQTTARHLGISALVHVQRFTRGESRRPGEARTSARQPARASEAMR